MGLMRNHTFSGGPKLQIEACQYFVGSVPRDEVREHATLSKSLILASADGRRGSSCNYLRADDGLASAIERMTNCEVRFA